MKMSSIEFLSKRLLHKKINTFSLLDNFFLTPNNFLLLGLEDCSGFAVSDRWFEFVASDESLFRRLLVLATCFFFFFFWGGGGGAFG